MDPLDEVRHSWNAFAESDAMGAVMTGEDWDENAFYQSGLSDIDGLIDHDRLCVSESSARKRI